MFLYFFIFYLNESSFPRWVGLFKGKALFLLRALDFVVKVWEQELGDRYVLGGLH